MQQVIIDDRYSLSGSLGTGGMAEVHLARDELLGRDVALKVLKGRYTEDEEFVERFRQEARSAASLSHPNIVPVYDRGESGEDAGAHYIAMEYVSGGTLKEYIENEGPLEPGKTAAVGVQITSALEAAHEQGVVHRDIKPQNVLVTETGDVKVADFGIARAGSGTQASREISQTSRVMGTASYMAPEQALGEDVTPHSDLYSLGVTLYEMLTGEVPFTGESPVTVSMKHVSEPPRPPAEVDPDIPEAMSTLVMKLLSKDPADRYGSAAETGDALQMVSDGLPAAVVANSSPGAAKGAAEGASGTTHEPDQVSTSSLAPPAVPARAFRVRAARSRSRKLIPLIVALALLGTVLSLGFLWEPKEGSVIGSLEDFPGAGAIGEAREALGDAGQASLGPEEAEISDVEGLAEEEALERLDAAGFGAETRSRASSEEDAGRVLEQSAPVGLEAQEGSRVLLAIGSGPQGSSQIAVPDLAGLRYAEATDTLREAGLASGGRYETPSETVPAGAVVEQGIASGEAVASGTAVNLTVSSGSSVTATPTASSTGASGRAGGQAFVPNGTNGNAGEAGGTGDYGNGGNGDYGNSDYGTGQDAEPGAPTDPTEGPSAYAAPQDDDEDRAGERYRDEPVEVPAPADGLIQQAPQPAAPPPADPRPLYEPSGGDPEYGSTGEQYE